MKNLIVPLFIILTFTSCKLKKPSLKYELFEDYYKEAEKIMETMTVEEKAGQVFIAAFINSRAHDHVTKKHVGGFCLFANDFAYKTADEIRAMLDNLNNAAKIKLSFGADEEGGTVSRIGQYFRKEGKFLSPHDYYDQGGKSKGGLENILKYEQEKIDLMKSLHLNYNFAPVADMSTDPKDFIYKRSLGQTAKTTSDFIGRISDLYNQNTFTCCLKHFPGYGNNSDTHTGPAEDFRTLNNFYNYDFKPFQAGINWNVSMIMFSHNIVHSMGGKSASISPTAHEILRNNLQYTGLIVTDSLTMAGVKSTQRAIDAMNAGNDILLTSDFDSHYDELIRGIREGKVNMDNLEKACRRVLAWKLKFIYQRPVKKE